MKIEKLREIREENNHTQKELSELINVSLGTYAMNETGHDTITLVNLIKICDIYQASVDYILGLNNSKNYPKSQSSFDKNILRTRLKEIRKEKNYTQEKIGKLLNIDHSVWCRYEQGKTTIPTIFLYEICQKFCVSADYLLGKIDEPKYLK